MIIRSIMLKIDSVKVIDNYRIHVRFDNGVEKLCDISPFLEKGNFRELRDKKMFCSVRAIKWGIEWDNGLDLSADTLDSIGKPVKHQADIAV